MNNTPFVIPDFAAFWGRWALGYGVLWFLLILMVESGAGELAAALAVLVAGGMTVVALDTVIKDLGFASPAKGG